MGITYTPPPTITVDDNNVVISNNVDEINFGTGLTVTDDGFGKITVAAGGGSTITVEDNDVLISNTVNTLNFDRNLHVADNGSGQVSIDSTIMVWENGTFIEDAYAITAGIGLVATTNGNGFATIDIENPPPALGSIIVITFASTANSISNKFLDTENIAASDSLPGVLPLTGTINKVTYSGTNDNGVSCTLEFRINTTTGTPTLSVPISVPVGQKTATATVSLAVAENDQINCKIAGGASNVSKPLVKCYV